ncbi:MAG: hypothetical protein HYT66_00490, partial [Candidatus Yanofskybacteria bacterium]|nr:hypothetical protein [Candidatus Yanofskybacteria bacterium]
NDFNTQEALGHLFSLIRALNLPLSMGAISKEYAKPVLEFLNKVDGIFGIVPINHEEVPRDIIKLVTKRAGLRAGNNYDEADKIRAQIEEMGYRVDDTAYGPLVRLAV